MNITELARKLKVTPNELKQRLPKLGFHIGLRAIQIPDKQAAEVMNIWFKEKAKEKTINKIKEKISSRVQKELKSPEEIILGSRIQVYRLAEKLNVPLTKIMAELVKNGMLISLNEYLDFEIAAIIAEDLGFKVKKGETKKEEHKILIREKLKEIISKSKNKLIERAPVVVVMGHVDHGKSAILQAIRDIEMLSKEAGGITQHIGAYQIEKNNRKITFIDTPGHEAFQSMRAQGGQVADIAILVVAADDKIQAQTLESIKVIQEEKLPFVVAINKIDSPKADVDKIKKELAEINLIPEDWGGKVICVPTSATTKKGIKELLDMILLLADMNKEKLLADLNGQTIGVVIESHLDPGVGPIASLIIYNGILKQGDYVVIGNSYGRVRSILDQNKCSLQKAVPGQPVQIFGIKNLPLIGSILETIPNIREFKKRIKNFKLLDQRERMIDKIQISDEKKKKSKCLNIILRADVLGSLKVIHNALKKMEIPQVKINILKESLGDITEADIELAQSTKSEIIGFNVDINRKTNVLAKEMNVSVHIYQIIYDLIEAVKENLNKLIPHKIIENKLGKIKILAIFKQTGKQIILGGRTIEGEIRKNTLARIWRNNNIQGEGKIIELQVGKQDVEKVESGRECGLKFEGETIPQVGDILEIYEEIKK